MTGLPAAFSALALASTASVADSEIAEMRAETLVAMGFMLAGGATPPDPPPASPPGDPSPRTPLGRDAIPPDPSGPLRGIHPPAPWLSGTPGTRRFDGRAVRTYTAWTNSGAVVAAACPCACGGC